MKPKFIVIIVVMIFIGVPIFLFYAINKQIEPQIVDIARIEANNAATNVILHAVESLKLDTEDLVYNMYDEEGKVIGINYDTTKLNNILSKGLDASERSLQAATSGEIDPNTYMLYYDRGIIYSVPLGYFTGIALFSDFGPKINVRLKVLHTNQGEIQVTTSPYGINNTLVEIDLVITTQMTVITPFIANTVPIECRIPLVIQITQGEIPQMFFEKIAG